MSVSISFEKQGKQAHIDSNAPLSDLEGHIIVAGDRKFSLTRRVSPIYSWNGREVVIHPQARYSLDEFSLDYKAHHPVGYLISEVKDKINKGSEGL